jgi:hypothetical protein
VRANGGIQLRKLSLLIKPPPEIGGGPNDPVLTDLSNGVAIREARLSDLNADTGLAA